MRHWLMFTVRCYFMLKLFLHSSCPCGGVFDDFRRAMAGVLVVVGLVPSKLEDALNSARCLGSWFWGQRTRHLHIRVRLREAKLKESSTDWLADRDFCVSLVEVSGLTGDQL